MTVNTRDLDVQVTRLAVFSQLLFTAGHAITSRGFFYYFVNEFSPSARMMALLQVAPESAATLGSSARSLIRRWNSKKWLWVGGVLLSRLTALAIPFMLFLKGTPLELWSLPLILVSTLTWNGLQGVAYVTYLSWMSDLVTARYWGWFFARWNIAALLVALVASVAVSSLQNHLLRGLSPDWRGFSYGLIFVCGGLLVIASTLPMLSLPDTQDNSAKPGNSFRPSIWSTVGTGPYGWFVAHFWWLSFFQGLTQSVLFLFQSRVLGISLATYTLLNGAMLLLQIPLSLWGGNLSDRNLEQKSIAGGLILTSMAMGFFLLATAQTWWWVWGAYLAWGLFGMVNVCEQSLNLKLAPKHDNTLHLSLVKQWGGAWAAVAGIIGGWWLDALVPAGVSSATAVSSFHSIFLLSWLGRATAPLWLLGIRRTSKKASQ